MELIERYQLTQYDKESMMQGNKKLANHKNFGGADYFAREKVGASAHFFVDETEIWESVPVTECAWH